MPTAARTCGSCSLCCKVYAFVELAKPAGQWCAHFSSGAGCTIHVTRPGVCRAFHCNWIYSPSLGEDWKPNVSRFVMSELADNLYITVDESSPQAWRRAPYHNQILSWARAKWQAGRHAVVAVGRTRFVLFPQEAVEFSLPDGAAFKVGYQDGGGMRRPWVQITSEDGGITEVLGKPEVGRR